MKPLAMLLAGVILAAMCGCEPADNPKRDGVAKIDKWLVNSFSDAAINNAIIRQHTLFPYHFTPDSPELNELGRRDLGVLAAHYREHPGKLNIRRGDVSNELYDARVKAVGEMLAEANAQTQRIQIRDELPGGDGMVSEKVVIILLREREGTSGSPAAPAER